MPQYKTAIGRPMAAQQSENGPPVLKAVSVAVLPPRLPANMAPPTGVGVSGAMAWDEAVNWQHNEPIKQPEVSKRKQFMRDIGLTTQRARKNPDLPPFMFRQVPYEIWRMHYAKDAQGNYRGTHAPAEDCLLKPEDVAKWRYGDEPVTQADKWTRGTEVLPVYAEVKSEGDVPDYDAEYVGGVAPGEPTVDDNATSAPPLGSHHAATDQSTGKIITGGRTASQIIADAKLAHSSKPKMTWKQRVKKGAEFAMMGANTG